MHLVMTIHGDVSVAAGVVPMPIPDSGRQGEQAAERVAPVGRRRGSVLLGVPSRAVLRQGRHKKLTSQARTPFRHLFARGPGVLDCALGEAT